MKKELVLAFFLLVLAVPLAARGESKIGLTYAQTLLTDAAGGQLKSPAGVSCRGDSIYVADTGNKRIIHYVEKDGKVAPDKVFPVPQMVPLMVQSNGKGDLYVLDGKDRKIYLLSPQGDLLGNLEPKGLPSAEKIVPRSIKVGSDGTVYILDIFSARVLELDSAGKYLRQIPFPSDYGFFSDVAVDNQGNVFLLDSVKAEVFVTREGSQTFQPLGAGMKNEINFPTSLVPDNKGNLLLVDEHGGCVVIVGMDGSFLGRRLSMGWRDGQLRYPTEIDINDKGNLFIADKGNNRVQEFILAE